MQHGTLLTAIAGTRTAMGAVRVAAPQLVGLAKLGPGEAMTSSTRVFVRALGFRDLVLGTTTLAAVSREDEVRADAAARLGILFDAADLAATLVSIRQLPGRRRWVVPAIGATMLAAGLAKWAALDTDEIDLDEGFPTDGMDGAIGDEGDFLSVAEQAGIVDQQDAALTAMHLE